MSNVPPIIAHGLPSTYSVLFSMYARSVMIRRVILPSALRMNFKCSMFSSPFRSAPLDIGGFLWYNRTYGRGVSPHPAYESDYLLSLVALLDFGFLNVNVTLMLSTASLLLTAFATSCKAFSISPIGVFGFSISFTPSLSFCIYYNILLIVCQGVLQK